MELIFFVLFGLLLTLIVVLSCIFMKHNSKTQRILRAIFFLPFVLIWFGLCIFWMVVTEK